MTSYLLPAPAPHHRRMKALALAGALVLLLAACSSDGSDASSNDETTTTTTTTESTTTVPTEPVVLPEDRPVDVHVPPGYDPEEPAPLLVLLHGFGVTGDVQNAYMQLEPAVDAEGMLYVYPTGTIDPDGDPFWNATDACCGPESDVDDSAYLRDVITMVQQDYNVDPDRIFLLGHSNGGFMSFRMACDHADTIAALVSVAGATFEDPADCAPSEPVSTLQIHGVDDETIFYEGGEIGRSADRTYPSAVQTQETWAGYNGCELTLDDPAPESRSIISDVPPATATAYSTGCENGTASELWTQSEGVHIPAFTPAFGEQAIAWLLAHPKD